MNSSGALSALVKKTVEGLGYELVDVERLQRGLVRVTIDIERDGGISLEDCERVSDQLTHLFTVEDVSYERLEVSSPGVERPLKRARDWERFTGELAWVELFAPLKAEGFPEAGRRKLEGRIVGISGESGAEQIEFDYFEVDIARTPRAACPQKADSRSCARARCLPAFRGRAGSPPRRIEFQRVIHQ